MLLVPSASAAMAQSRSVSDLLPGKPMSSSKDPDQGASSSASSGLLAAAGSAGSVVRGFFGDEDVMHVAFAQAGASDAHETRALLHLGDGLAAGIAHPRAQAADELRDDLRNRAAVGHTALDALGHQLLVRGAGLSVAVFAALAH